MVFNAHGLMRSRFTNDVATNPVAFFDDLKMGSRLRTCNILLILDCSYPARILSHEAIGRYKLETLPLRIYSYDQGCHSSGRAEPLSECMQRLLKRSPDGFSTSDLFRELYPWQSAYKVARGPRHLDSDDSDLYYGKIWLRPQRSQPRAQTSRHRVFMNVTFELDGYPDDGVTVEIARALRHLPHVDQIRLEKIYETRATLVTLIRVVNLVVWMQRWCRKTRERLHEEDEQRAYLEDKESRLRRRREGAEQRL